MSFPHRTAIHDDKYDEIHYPEDIRNNRLIDPEGVVWIVETREATMEEIVEKFESDECLDDYNHRLIAVSNRFTKLASTGLEDSEGNEIFEGHIVKTRSKPSLEKESNVVVWMDGSASFSMQPSNVNIGKQWSVEITGHALTDPNLVPDSFDTEEYFNNVGR